VRPHRILLAAVIAIACAGCAKPARTPPQALTLQGNLLTIDNRTDRDWTQVEVWINQTYRATTANIPAHGRVNATLDGFTAGFGQRFDFHRMQIHDLRLTAKQPDGSLVEIVKPLGGDPLVDTMKGLGGKR
jgi:hypothetical protein